MAKGQGVTLLMKWNRRTREIKGVSSMIDNHLDLVRGQRVLWIFKRVCGSDDLDRSIRVEFVYELVDQARLDQRFVALDVDDEGKLFRLVCDLGYPIGS